MGRAWNESIEFKTIEINFEKGICTLCGSKLYVGVKGDRRIYTLGSPVRFKRKRAHCANPKCANSQRQLQPDEERDLALPRWKIGWDVFCWIGFRRFKRHWSVPQICEELRDSFSIDLSPDAIESYVLQYQVMVAARHQDIHRLCAAYDGIDKVVLSIDGLQPEKGHETLYVVRELRLGRVWFAEPLVSSSNAELNRLLQRAKNLCEEIGVEAIGWVSDKQSSIVRSVKEVFPGRPHRYCDNHFVRDAAKPITDLDSQGKVKMRSRVRGLRTIEQEVLEASRLSPKDEKVSPQACKIVMTYCSAVRGILNHNEGGPLQPAGYKMRNALQEIKDSLSRLLDRKIDAPIDPWLQRLSNHIETGTAHYDNGYRMEVEEGMAIIRVLSKHLQPEEGSCKQRKRRFDYLRKKLLKGTGKWDLQVGKIMTSFRDGLFAGGDSLDIPADNLALERWFKNPKGHARRITGNKHVGTKVVYLGPTLIPTLDAHLTIDRPLSSADLHAYINAAIPKGQMEATERHQTMVFAASKKKDSG